MGGKCLMCGATIAQTRNYCNGKCYDKYRYKYNINGRQDKLRCVEKLKKLRQQYINKLSADELLREVQEL